MAKFRALGQDSLSEQQLLCDSDGAAAMTENRSECERAVAAAVETGATAADTSRIVEWIAKNAKIDNVLEDELIQEPKNRDRLVTYLRENRLLTAYNTRTARQNLYTTIDGLPLVRFHGLVYWLKKRIKVATSAELTFEEFQNGVNYGYVNNELEKCILKLVDDVYLPLLRTTIADFPLIAKNTLFHDIQKFLTKLTDLHYKLSGLNVIYVPQVLNFDNHVNNYEELVLFWCEQIRNCLNDTEQKNDSLASLTLKDEAEFWSYRYDNLSSLKHQISSTKNVRSIIDYLKSNESIVAEKFTTLVGQLDVKLDVTIRNVYDLRIFDEIDRDFWQSHDSLDVRHLIIEFLCRFRVFWLRSRYFAEKSRMTYIFRIFAQQLLAKCSQLFLADFDLFGDRIPALNRKISMLENSIAVLDEFFIGYSKMENLFKSDERCPWVLEKSSIFDPIVSITKRLQYLIGICEAQIVFRDDWKDDESSNCAIDHFMVPGSNYQQYEAEYSSCVRDFERSLVDIQSVSDSLLDLPTEQWFQLTRKLDVEIREIEKRIESIFNRLVSELAEIDVANYIDLLIAFVHFQRRPYLRAKFAEKSLDILKMFQADIGCAKKFLYELGENSGGVGADGSDETGFEALNFGGKKSREDVECGSNCLLPPNSGLVLMHKLTIERLTRVQTELMYSPIGWTVAQQHDIHDSLKSFEQSVELKTQEQFRKWCRTLGDCSRYSFHVPLVKFDRHAKQFECRLDPAIKRIAAEAVQWTRMNIPIPYYLDAMARKFNESVRVKYEALSLLELEWEEIRAQFTSSNDPNQQLFFANLFERFANRIEPQSLSIYWLSDKSDWLTNQIQMVFDEIRELVRDYRMCLREREKNPDLKPEFENLMRALENSVEK